MSILPAVSANAERVDGIFLMLVVVAGAILLLLFALIVTFAFLYRRGSTTPRPPLRPIVSREIEIGWTAATAFAFLFVFWWVASIQLSSFASPTNAMEVHVVGKQWMWKYQHASGAREINDLHVPEQTAVRLVMVSQDVIHSLFIPALRIKQDVLPGRYTEIWFKAEQPGVYPILCAEFCGTNHAAMTGRLVVMHASEYAAWSDAQDPGMSLASRGGQLFGQLGCTECHTSENTARGPALAGLYGREIELEHGPPRTADESYLREAILQPNIALVRGYAAGMPGYQGKVSEEEVSALIAHLRVLSGEESLP